ncbi:MAG: helix-turn-helix transcriptional regulator [Clostridia bacterium]|jgi:transcriptional regulator with XRE-family HTH domain|nr:helix-turn-helix transcriptional regulator [Clostridia bacterium]
MSYIEVIKQIMAENALSQQKFADIIGVNQTTVSQWLMGKKKPNYDSIYAIYRKFHVEPNVLFGIDL